MNDQFSVNANNYTTFSNLTAQECAALDTLGDLLPELLAIPTDLDPNSKLSSRFIEVCGKSRGMANYDTGFVKIAASVYTSGEDNGYERSPRLTYTYTAFKAGSNKFSTDAPADLEIIFMPAYLAILHSNAGGHDFIPQTIKAPDDIETIRDENARNVLHYTRTYQSANTALKNAANVSRPPSSPEPL